MMAFHTDVLQKKITFDNDFFCPWMGIVSLEANRDTCCGNGGPNVVKILINALSYNVR